MTKVLNHRLLTDDFLSHRYITFILYLKKKHTFENKGRVLSERTMKGPIALTVFLSVNRKRTAGSPRALKMPLVIPSFLSLNPLIFPLGEIVISSSEFLLDNLRHGEA